jgi:shikimate dehydrogenase
MSGNLDINGATRLFVLLGDPIARTKASRMVNETLAVRGLAGEAVVVPCQVNQATLAPVLAALRLMPNWHGAVVTMPNKEAILALLDEVTPEARQVGACNVVRREKDGRLVGTMFDGEGFVSGLQKTGFTLAGKRVFLYGLGGAGTAIAFALAKYGTASLTLHNRTAEKAGRLAATIRATHPAVATDNGPGTGTYDLVINASSIGMKDDDPLPLPLDMLGNAPVVADIIPGAALTPFLAAARERGCAVYQGAGMLAAQAGLITDYLLGAA